MSKVLYPKSVAVATKKAAQAPLHVIYTDPSGQMETVVKHYNSELAAKVAAWVQCRLVGWRTAAVLLTTKELQELAVDSVKEIKNA